MHGAGHFSKEKLVMFKKGSYSKKIGIRPLARLALALLPMALLAGNPAHAELRLAIPDDMPGLPYYVRLQMPADDPRLAPSDGIWSAVVAYRQSACIPEDYNLLLGFDFPDGFSCPLNPGFSGFEVWENPPGVDMAPAYYRLVADEPVPVLFVRTEELLAAASDGLLRMIDIEALPSIRIGMAEVYSELGQLKNGPFIHITASGTFENGDRFALTHTLAAAATLGLAGAPITRTEISYPGASEESPRPPRPFPFAGHWFNPALGGQGMEVAFPLDQQRMVGNWYGHDASGAPVWYAMDSAVSPELSTSEQLGFDGIRATVSVMAAELDNGSGPILTPVATLTVDFESCFKGQARFHDIAPGFELPTESFAIRNLVPVDDCRN
ncbi:MAG: hypothetical protein EA370_08395 [Wenzhouxiangella sp.]|nr:MAG: hypothetical protein EA370_08395 [Wenzhouxiangella sp.]